MKNRLEIFIGGFLVAVLIAACSVAVLKIDLTPKAAPDKPVERTRNFGEGLKLAQHGVYGIDLVSIGKAHMRKLRKGPFTIGAINELVLEDVELALPEEVWKSGQDKGQETSDKGGAGQTTENKGETGPRAMLAKLGLDAGNLKLGDKMPRFSALAIRNLRVSRLEESNAVPWFAAVRGEARRGGLALESGWSVENGKTNSWKEALLVVEPELRLYSR